MTTAWNCNYLLDYYRLTGDNRLHQTAAAWSTAHAIRDDVERLIDAELP